MRKQGENIRERMDGRWEARVVQGAPVNGKTNYKYLYGRTYEDASQKKKEFVQAGEAQNGHAQEQQCPEDAMAALSEETPFENPGELSTEPTIKKIAEDWLAEKKMSVKESSFSYYTTMVKNHVISVLGNICVKEVTADLLSDYFAERKARGRVKDGKTLADKTVADLKSIVKQILIFAQESGFITSVPACPAANARVQPVSILTEDEQMKVEEVLYTQNDTFSLGVILSLYGGPRIGEVCALKWEDFDFENETIQISKTVSRIRDEDRSSVSRTKVVITSPKTESSVRTIPLPTGVFAYFKNRRREGSMYVVTGTEKYMEPRVYRARYKTLLRRAGVSAHTYHCLRHTFATRCVESGVDFKSLSEIMGHSDVKITMQRYVHPSMDFKKEQVNKLQLPGFLASGKEAASKEGRQD